MVVLRECTGVNDRDRDLGLRFVVVVVCYVLLFRFVIRFGEVREDGDF